MTPIGFKTQRSTDIPASDRRGHGDILRGDAGTPTGKEPESEARRAEIFAFIVLAILIWPVLAIGVVGSYGFLVWMSQILFGPPGPPH